MRDARERLNQLIGFLVGDGFYYMKRSRKNYLVGFVQSSKRREIPEVYKSLLSIIFNRKPIEERAPNNVVKVYIYSKDAYYFFKEIKDDPAKYFRQIPPEEKIKFLGGFTDAEGTVKRDRIILYNANRDLLIEIQEFLKTLGVRSTLHYHHGAYELHIWEKRSREIIMALCKNYSSKISSLFS